MKKNILGIFLIGLFAMLLIPTNTFAGTISTIDVAESNGNITASGTTGTGVDAIALVIYNGDNLVSMETCSVDNNDYSCTFSKTFSNGTYIVKVADYNGGDYVSKKIIINNGTKASNPNTGDGILTYVIIGIVSLIGILLTTVLLKKKRFN